MAGRNDTERFFEFYALVIDKEARIVDYLFQDALGVHWNVELRRNLYEWVTEEYLLLLEAICTTFGKIMLHGIWRTMSLSLSGLCTRQKRNWKPTKFEQVFI